jgi:hypothetical protein
MLQTLCLVPRPRHKILTAICSTQLNIDKERVNYLTRFFNWLLVSCQLFSFTYLLFPSS